MESSLHEGSWAELFYSVSNGQNESRKCVSWVTNKAVQVHGGYGYIKEYDVERFSATDESVNIRRNNRNTEISRQ